VPPMHGWVAKFGALLAGTAVALLLAEAALRLAGVEYPVFWVPDQNLGVAHNPGTQGWYRDEGNAFVRINSDGLRGPERAKTKPPGTVRIALLGDSFTEAVQVPLEDTFGSVLEKQLADCPRLKGLRVEVINFGVSGYGTGQELLMLRRHVWEYSPDLVVLAFLTANDVSDNSFTLSSSEPGSQERPYFEYHEGSLVLDNSFRDSSRFQIHESAAWRLLRRLAGHLRLLQLAREARVRWADRQWLQEAERRAGTANPVVAEAVLEGPEIYLPPADPDWQAAWHVTEGLLDEMKKEVTAKGADFWVVTLSNPIQVYPDAVIREQFKSRQGIQDLFYPDHRIQAFCGHDGIHMLALAPAMQAFADPHHVFLHGFSNAFMGTGHWNIEGHRLAGELIARKLCEQGKF
jgi:lysophospholipase L1-like esterase